MDTRLRTAVDASVGWYGDIFALHGVGAVLDRGLWVASGPPPPLHSAVLTVEPSVAPHRVLAALEGVAGGFKDSFVDIDVVAAGMRVLFEATWIHRSPGDPGDPADEWVAVTTAAGLATWTAGHHTSQVLVPGLLRLAHVVVLARMHQGSVVAGAVARLGSGAVDISNVHHQPGFGVDWDTLARAVWRWFPGRPIVGYERGSDLAAALGAGFQPVGDLRVWTR